MAEKVTNDMSSLAEAVLNVLGIALDRVKDDATMPVEPYLVWKKAGPTQWQGQYEHRLDLNAFFETLNWDKLEAGVEGPFAAICPSRPIGSADTGWIRLTSRNFLRHAIAHAYRASQRGTVDLPRLARTICEGLSHSVIRVRFLAPVLNFSAESNVLDVPLPGNLTLHQLTEHEVTEAYGGPLSMLAIRGDRELIEWGLVGQCDIPVTIFESEREPNESYLHANVAPFLKKAVRALRITKAGPVGCLDIHVFPDELCPFALGNVVTRGNEYVPRGPYHLEAADTARLVEVSRWLAQQTHPSIEAGIDRLATASVRLEARDKLIDAVVGMEAILLASESDRGELRYRFSLNYAVHHDPGETRVSAFKRAKDMYGLRSKIAHGGGITDATALKQKAEQADAMLRELVYHYLPQGRRAQVREADYWDELVLNGRTPCHAD